MNFIIKRSRRKSFSLQLKDEDIIVRVPLLATKGQIEKFINSHRSWIEKQLALREKRIRDAHNQGPLTESDIKNLTRQASEYIPKRVEHYAKLIGVSYGNITIRHQKTRWGSCNSKGNLNFNCLLMLTPPEVIDSIIVHELCHRKEMNHSKRFYAQVLKVFPDYKRWNKWLKQNGDAIMYRMLEGRKK